MSTRTQLPFEHVGAIDRVRAAALVAVAAALGATLQVLYHFVDVVGVPTRFLVLVALALGGATVLARVLPVRTAMLIGAAVLLAGLWWYVQQLSGSPGLGTLLADTGALLTGNSLLGISNIRAWVLAVTPAPVFLTWYFALRRRYGLAMAATGATLGFLVLTGDADLLTTLSVVVAATAALGLGDCERRGEPVVAGEQILVVAALMIVVPSLVSVVPATAGLSFEVAGGDGATVEANLLDSGDSLTVQGPVSLSPAVRFTVTSTEARYWRIGSFDRYTGDGWVSTTNERSYGGDRLSEPPGPTRIVDQRIRAEQRAEVMPAAWKPVSTSGNGATRVDGDGSLATGRPIEAGDSYRVVSAVPAASPRQLADATGDPPASVIDTYTQLPDSTPERVGRLTDRLTANADSPYETALTIETWLANNRAYSLDVRRPDGSIADSFLFEMDAGYCTYFATTMVTMLRSQDVPARLAVGYTPGERVAEDRWVVRGLNAHAWVEVYIAEHGWVRFDPTPASDREQAEQERVQSARERNETNVDTNESSGQAWTPTPTVTPEPLTPTGNASAGDGGPSTPIERPGSNPTGPVTTEGDPASGDGGPSERGPGDSLPSRQETALGLLAIVGLAIGARRSDLGARVYRRIWLYYQPRTDPESDIERAFQRAMTAVDRSATRSRHADETVREYLAAVDADPRAREVAAIRERSRYGGLADEAAADRAVALADDIVR